MGQELDEAEQHLQEPKSSFLKDLSDEIRAAYLANLMAFTQNEEALRPRKTP